MPSVSLAKKPASASGPSAFQSDPSSQSSSQSIPTVQQAVVAAAQPQAFANSLQQSPIQQSLHPQSTFTYYPIQVNPQPQSINPHQVNSSHSVNPHPVVDGTPLHDPTESNPPHHAVHPSVAAIPQELLAAFQASTSQSNPAQTQDSSQQQHQQLPMPSFPPGTVPVAYFAGPGGSIIAIPQLKTKRRQVKHACTNCQKACKKCGEERPCSRCVKYGIDKECIDSQRKERKKGIKRGPYKKRDSKNGDSDEHENNASSAAAAAAALAAAHMLTPESAAALQAMAQGAVIYSFNQNATATNQNQEQSSSQSQQQQQSQQQSEQNYANQSSGGYYGTSEAVDSSQSQNQNTFNGGNVPENPNTVQFYNFQAYPGYVVPAPPNPPPPASSIYHPSLPQANHHHHHHHDKPSPTASPASLEVKTRSKSKVGGMNE